MGFFSNIKKNLIQTGFESQFTKYSMAKSSNYNIKVIGIKLENYIEFVAKELPKIKKGHYLFDIQYFLQSENLLFDSFDKVFQHNAYTLKRTMSQKQYEKLERCSIFAFKLHTSLNTLTRKSGKYRLKYSTHQKICTKNLTELEKIMTAL